MYYSAVEDKRRNFTPLSYQLMACCSVRLCTLSNVYLPTWPLGRIKYFSHVLTLVRSRLLFASVYSASMFLGLSGGVALVLIMVLLFLLFSN